MDIENPMVIDSYWPSYEDADAEDFYERADLEYESRLDFGGACRNVCVVEGAGSVACGGGERLWQS